MIIPAYNEESRLPGYLEEVLAYLGRQAPSSEVIVVDDGSSDNTAALVERFSAAEPRVRLIRLPRNRGKGFAVKTGMLAARGALRLFTDADGATPIGELERLRKAVEVGADVAVASRAMRDDSRNVATRLHRKVMGTVFNWIVRTFAVRGINDTQCGFKLFTADAAATAFPLQSISGFGFDVEVLYICVKKGFRIKEVPVNWSDVKGSKVRLVRDSVRMFRDILTVRRNDRRGLYGGSR